VTDGTVLMPVSAARPEISTHGSLQRPVGEIVREARADLGLAAADEPTASEVAAMVSTTSPSRMRRFERRPPSAPNLAEDDPLSVAGQIH